jgi:CRISPR-associated protein Csx10
MHALNYKITLLSKVLISRPTTGQNMIETLEYLRGSTVLGTLASRYIFIKQLTQAHEDDTFYRWFLRGDLSFSNGYLMEQHTETTPTPLYIQQEKAGNAIYNILLTDPNNITKPLGGFSNINSEHIINIKPKKGISFHHERDRLTGTSKKGLFFNYESLLPSQAFKGAIYGSSKDLEDLKKIVGHNFKAKMGKSKGAEYGDVIIELLNIQKIDSNSLINENILEEGIFFTFISPCILYNELGMSDPTFSNIERHLQKIFGKDTFTIEGSIIKQEFIENYVSIWKMKKPGERAISAGSSLYLFFEYVDNSILNGIYNLLEKGIGERLMEGFGRVQITPATVEKYILNTANKKVEKPVGNPPAAVKHIFRAIVKEALFEKIKSEAIAETNKFKGLPKNSLLGRLKLMVGKTGYKNFSTKIAQLKETAKNQLRSCRYYEHNQAKESLLDYLSRYDQ